MFDEDPSQRFGLGKDFISGGVWQIARIQSDNTVLDHQAALLGQEEDLPAVVVACGMRLEDLNINGIPVMFFDRDRHVVRVREQVVVRCRDLFGGNTRAFCEFTEISIVNGDHGRCVDARLSMVVFFRIVHRTGAIPIW